MLLTISVFLITFTLVYAALLIYLSTGLKRLKQQKRSKEQPPLTVIVCAHNEEHNLPACISHLKAQVYPTQKIEFILINDRSSDSSEKIMQQACLDDPRFKTITISGRIAGFAPKKRAIDTAVKAAQNEILLFTDADGRPGPDWAKTMVSFFDAKISMVLGYAPYTIKPAAHFTKKILALEYLSHASVAAATSGLGFPVTCVGTNMAYRKSMYLAIDGFGEYKNQISGDDDLFLTRVREYKKYHIAYADDAKTQVFNNPPRLWSKFIHQRMRYASKGFKYPLKVTAALLTYFVYNLLLFVLSFTVWFNREYLLLFLAVLAVKWAAEFFFMYKAGKALSDLRNMKVFFFAALFHIPYIVVFAILGQFDFFKWAETTAEPGVQKGNGSA